MRWVMWFEYNKPLPKDLCALMGNVLAATTGTCMFVVFGLSLIYFFYWVFIRETIVGITLVFFSIIAGIGYLIDRMVRNSKFNQVTTEFFKSRKEKYCPLIEWTGEDNGEEHPQM